MFCTNCGQKLDASWNNCAGCGRSISNTGDFRTDKGTGTRKFSQLPYLSLAHWQACGMPSLIYEGPYIRGFEATNDAVEQEYLRFGKWYLNDTQKFINWLNTGAPLFDLYLEVPAWELPADSKVLTKVEAQAEIVKQNWNVKRWNAEGKPTIVKHVDGTLGFADILSWYKYERRDILLVDETPASAAKSISQVSGTKPNSKKEKFVRITSESEVRRLCSRESYKLWKKRGRPPIVIIGDAPMYETQHEFLQIHGVPMSDSLLDTWYWAGCPNLESWDYESDAFAHTQVTLAAIQGLSNNSVFTSSLIDSFTMGVNESIQSIANESRRTRLCMKCGRTLLDTGSGTGCIYCFNS